MSISLLYHGFGIVGYQYLLARYENGAIIIFKQAVLSDQS
jgi:hypothetical protein